MFKESRSGTVEITAIVQDDRVSLRGRGSLNVNVGQALIGEEMKEDPPSAIERRGMRGSPAMVWWEELEAVARTIGGEVLYARD